MYLLPGFLLPLKSFYRLLFVIVLLAIIQQSCKKTDFAARPTKTITAEDFFKTQNIPSKKVASIIQALRLENAKTGFVDKLPFHAGLPIWDKLTIKQSPDVAARGEGDTTETYIIPLTENEHNLSSVIVARELDSSFLITCYTAAYLNGMAAGVNGNNMEAVHNTLLLFFMMESKCFGTSEFHHIPRMLFPQSHRLGSDSNKIITIMPDTTGDSLVKCVVFKHCIKTAPCTEGSCDWCPLCISTYCYGSIPPGPEPPEPGGGGGGGGGTPCTNCPPPPPTPVPCDQPFYLVDPCAPTPVPPEPPYFTLLDIDADSVSNPCVKGIITQMGSPTMTSFLIKLYQKTQVIPNNDKVSLMFIENNSLVGNNGNPTAGHTYVNTLPDGTREIKISLNPSYMANASKEFITTVILHELIHGFRKIKAPNLTQEEQHQEILDGLAAEIATSLHDIFPNLLAVDAVSLSLQGLEDVTLDANGNIKPAQNQIALDKYSIPLATAMAIAQTFFNGSNGTPC